MEAAWQSFEDHAEDLLFSETPPASQAVTTQGQTNRKIISLSVTGVVNTACTQCNWITVAVADDGTAWSMRDTDNEWHQLPNLPPSIQQPFPETL